MRGGMIMMRSFADRFGRKWPREWAMIVDHKPVTWADIHRKRAERDKRNIARKREPRTQRHAAYIWVFYQPGLFGFAYMGWWLYIRTVNESYAVDFRGLNSDLALKIMRLVPCGILPAIENFEQWKEAFATEYHRPGRFKQQGLLAGWATVQDGNRVIDFEL